MQVLEIQFSNHAAVGSLKVNFCRQSGDPSRVVIIAGENGCGKTLILNTIYSALNNRSSNQLRRDTESKGEVMVIVKDTTSLPPDISRKMGLHPEAIDNTDQAEKSFGLSMDTIGMTFGMVRFARLDLEGVWQKSLTPEMSYSQDCIFSEAAHTLRPYGNGISLTSVESKPLPSRSGSFNLSGEITKLLIELRTADQEELALWCENNPGFAPSSNQIKRRWTKFAEAYSRIFPHRKLCSISTNNGNYFIEFEENGKTISLDDFSGGEKQIIFRGAFLLTRIANHSKAIVLIDEPEIGFHPAWQEKVIRFYIDLVSEENNGESQVFIATHSPFIMHGFPEAHHIILSRNPTTQQVCVLQNPVFPGVTSADFAVAAFDLAAFLKASRDKRVHLFVEGKIDCDIIELAWKSLRGSEQKLFEITSADCAKNLNQLLRNPQLRAAFHAQQKAILGLFDFDEEGYTQWNGSVTQKQQDKRFCEHFHIRKMQGLHVWAMLLPIPSFRMSYASQSLGRGSRLTIELMFSDKIIEEFADKIINPGDGSSFYLAIRDNAKNGLVKKLQAVTPSEFKAFIPLFASLDQIALETAKSYSEENSK